MFNGLFNRMATFVLMLLFSLGTKSSISFAEDSLSTGSDTERGGCESLIAHSHSLAEDLASLRHRVSQVQAEMNRNVIGQQRFINRLLIGLLTNSHILVESSPGLAKTTAAKLIAKSVSVKYGRIQFTPDLGPSDITGYVRYDHDTKSEIYSPGPLVNNIVLADEINRGNTLVQSALLEAMSENSITVGGSTRKMDSVFMVIATMNPINKDEGTNHLPSAQVDRFMFKLILEQPDFEDELAIVRLARSEGAAVQTRDHIQLSKHDLLVARRAIKTVEIPENVLSYIVRIKQATHSPLLYARGMKHGSSIERGAGPRASISLDRAAQAYAWLDGRTTVTHADVREVAHDVLRGRIILKKEAPSQGITIDSVIQDLLNNVPDED